MPKSKISTLTGAARLLGDTKFLSSPSPRLFNYAGITAAIGLASLPALLTLAPIVTPQGASAVETTNAETGGIATLSINPALAITAENITVSATPTVGKTFVTTSSTVNVKNTGSGGGYHLIMSSNNDGILKTDDNAHSVSTFSEYSKTGTDMKNASSSSWGYTLQSVSGSGSVPSTNNGLDLTLTYLPIPTSSTAWNQTADQEDHKYAYLKNTTDYTNTTTGDNILIGYAFAIGSDATAGTYTDTITYTAIPNPDTHTIFDMTNMQDLATHSAACSNTPTPAVRTGDTPDTAVTASMTSLTGYSIGQTNVDKIPTKTLKDARDNNTYTIRKLADGNCWMTSSLKIAGTDATHPRVLTSADSNVTTDCELPAAVAVGSTADDNAKAYVSNGGVNGTYLYNWFAATAGSGTASVTSGNASQDICPRGWHLPNNDGNASWNKLLRQGQGVYEIATSSNGYSTGKVSWGTYAGISTAASNPVGLQLTGYFYGGSLDGTGNGDYWSRTASSADSAYHLGYYSSNVYPQGDDNKVHGFGVRCVSE